MSLIQRENKVAMAKGSTWGTAEAPTGSNGLFVKAHTPPKGARKVVTNEDEFGRGMATTAELLEYEAQSGSMSLRLYSEGLEAIVASLMGIYGYTADGSEAGIGKHKFTMDTVMENIFHTIAWDEGDQVKAVNSASIVSGTFSYQDGLNLDVNYLGDKVSVAGFSLSSTTYPSEGKSIFKLSNAQVWINNEGDAALGSGDELYPSGIDIAVTRGIEGLPITVGSETVSDLVEKTAPVIEVTLTFPKKETETAAYFDAFNNRDFKKLQVKFVGEDIAGTVVAGSHQYEIEFNFPRLFMMEAPDYAQDTPIPTTIKLKALMTDSAPGGMDETVPYIVLQNKVSELSGYPSS
jgi:hypothetical protein